MMKPSLSRRGRTKKGRYVVQNPKKYLGNSNKVFYRSSWEAKVCRYCDVSPLVEAWGSEEVSIPYMSPIDGKIHSYFIDFVIRYKDRTVLVEVKPSKQVALPKLSRTPQTLREQRSLRKKARVYGVNSSKWRAASKYAESRGMKFEIWDEFALRTKGIM